MPSYGSFGGAHYWEPGHVYYAGELCAVPAYIPTTGQQILVTYECIAYHTADGYSNTVGNSNLWKMCRR